MISKDLSSVKFFNCVLRVKIVTSRKYYNSLLRVKIVTHKNCYARTPARMAPVLCHVMLIALEAFICTQSTKLTISFAYEAHLFSFSFFPRFIRGIP